MWKRAQTDLPADLQVLDNGLVFTDERDKLEYFWFHLIEYENGHAYPLHRVVRLKMLRYLPQENRQDAGLLDTMRTGLTGIYNQRIADYDPCMLVAGIFDPPLGVLQCYGAIGTGSELDQALHDATLGMGAVEGVMANFPQSRLEPLDIQKAEWLRRAFTEMENSLVVIGQPDPRMNARGMGREGPAEKSVTMTGETAYTMQQNEMLFRAMSRLQEEFLFLVLASRLAQNDLAMMLEGIASEASVPASRQTGAKSISFGISLPMIASGNLGQSAGANYGQSEGQSVADGVAESEATSHTEGHATTVGHAVTDGIAHTEGHASSSGGSVSHSVSVVEGTSHVDGTSRGSADSIGSAHTVGRASSRGGSSSVSSSVTQVPEVSSFGGTESHSQSMSVSMGGSHAESAGTVESAGVSSGVSDQHSGGHSQGYQARGGIGIVGGGVNEGVTETFGHTESSGGQVRISARPLQWKVEIQVQCVKVSPGPKPMSDDEEASLDMAHRLADLCGGRLTLSTRESTFAATLVLPALEQLPVLVIDDNADTLQLLRRYAAGTRYCLISTQDPEQALSLAEEFSPQIILVDVMMPQMDGWEVLGQLRQHPLTSHIPIVVHTILAQEELALSLGASALLRKPVTRQDFLTVLDRLVVLMGPALD